METGILSDGSLSPRKKGDLFWKKYKLQEQAEREHKHSRHAELFIKSVMALYIDTMADPGEKLDGNEFKIFPPTATGWDIKRHALARAMKCRDGFKMDGGGESALAAALSDTITAFFSARGFDEATGTLTEGTDLKAAQAVLEEKVKLFEEAYHNEMGAGDDVKLPGREFTKTRLRSSDFVLYGEVFIELHVDEHTSEMAKLLEAAGMQVYTEKNNIYECTLKEVAGERELLMAAQRLHCRPLVGKLIPTATRGDIVQAVIWF